MGVGFKREGEAAPYSAAPIEDITVVLIDFEVGASVDFMKAFAATLAGLIPARGRRIATGIFKMMTSLAFDACSPRTLRTAAVS